MDLHLFGSTTAVGYAFLNLAVSSGVFDAVIPYSRRQSLGSTHATLVDLNGPDSFLPSGALGTHSVLVSFAPIWLLSSFLERISLSHPHWFYGFRGVVACSSSSAITKRFASNRFDRDLVARLLVAEDQLLDTCRRLSISCIILRPTVIYGKVGPYGDQNLSLLLRQMRRLPFFPLPAETGMRQPIHATQLASVALHLVQQLTDDGWEHFLPDRLAVGGDTTLTYAQMLRDLQKVHAPGDPVLRCRFLSIPNRLFFLLSAPLFLRSPKAFEAVLRMGVDLSGFTPAHQLLGSEPQPFPVLPLA